MDYIDSSAALPPFQVRSLGSVRNKPKHVSPGTREGDILLVLNMSGILHYQNSQGKMIVEGGMVGLIPPEDCGVFYSDLDDPSHHFYCRFSGDYARELAYGVIKEKGARFFSVDSMSQLVSAFEQLPKVIRKDLPMQMGEYELSLARVLVTLSRKQLEEPFRISAHAIRQYIELNLDRLISLDEMAEHFRISKPALCRIAKKLLGTTIVTASNTIRIEYACELLRTQSMNVTEVAQRVGFEDVFYFSRVFKKRIGISPKKWQLGIRP